MKNKKAFTLIETIIAITLTTVVLTAVTGLILSTLLANQRNLHTLQANFLAQEGVEALRFMRDSNWLQNYSWDTGQWGQDFHVEGSASEPSLYLLPKICSGTAPCFELSSIEADGEVTTDNGFVFERRLDLSGIQDEFGVYLEGAMEVTCTVTWEERGEERSVQVSTTLTDWQ